MRGSQVGEDLQGVVGADPENAEGTVQGACVRGQAFTDVAKTSAHFVDFTRIRDGGGVTQC